MSWTAEKFNCTRCPPYVNTRLIAGYGRQSQRTDRQRRAPAELV